MAKGKTPTLRELQQVVRKFNHMYPVGSKVILRKDSGEVVTYVMGVAEVFHGESAIATFDFGKYSIEDNRVRRPAPRAA